MNMSELKLITLAAKSFKQRSSSDQGPHRPIVRIRGFRRPATQMLSDAAHQTPQVSAPQMTSKYGP